MVQVRRNYYAFFDSVRTCVILLLPDCERIVLHLFSLGAVNSYGMTGLRSEMGKSSDFGLTLHFEGAKG